MTRARRTLSVIAVALALAACGQKGDLVRPAGSDAPKTPPTAPAAPSNEDDVISEGGDVG